MEKRRVVSNHVTLSGKEVSQAIKNYLAAKGVNVSEFAEIRYEGEGYIFQNLKAVTFSWSE